MLITFIFLHLPNQPPGVFEDRDLVYALKKYRDDPYATIALAQLCLGIWMEVSDGSTTPRIADLACYFQKESEWDAQVRELWDACNLGLAYSDELHKQIPFFL